ncbi:MAG: hypothetical protein ACKPBU_05815 [Alphaproteobacteria bacterium]
MPGFDPWEAALGVGVWIAGLHVFDAVHCVLHAMLRSRHAALRALASPHAVHHRWLDAELRIHPEEQVANLWCHVVPEFATQVAFTLALASLLPAATIATALLLQVAVFIGVASRRGLDRNHLPIDVLDAYRPSVLALPAYHALHHVHPDAYYSAYSKAVDWVVGSGTMLRGRRFAVIGAESPFGAAIAAALEREGAATVDRRGRDLIPEAEQLASTDVLVLALPDARHEVAVERFVAATRGRRLPPEVWAVHTDSRDRVARHYHGDVRVNHRAIVVPAAMLREPESAVRAAASAMRAIRRGWNFVAVGSAMDALRALVVFRRTIPSLPAGAPVVPHRREAAVLDRACKLAPAGPETGP